MAEPTFPQGLPPLSLYVHIPWCLRKCPYCDFNSHALRDTIPERAYLDALLADLDNELPAVQGRPLHTVFIGGGTPSLFSAAGIERLLSGIDNRLTTAPGWEITLEANPTSVEAKNFAGYRAAGVNRVSVGVQALDDRALKMLGRQHTAKEALEAFRLAAKTFDRVSFDMI